MAQKKDPASVAVEFFNSAPVETAQTVLNICKGIVARRLPAKAKTRAGKTRIAGQEPPERSAIEKG